MPDCCYDDLIQELGDLPALTDNDFKRVVQELLCRLYKRPDVEVISSCFKRIDNTVDVVSGKKVLRGYVIVSVDIQGVPTETFYAFGGRELDSLEFEVTTCC